MNPQDNTNKRREEDIFKPEAEEFAQIAQESIQYTITPIGIIGTIQNNRQS
jgi:hypothetical protein